MRGPAPPKYCLSASWKEYHFLNFGTFSVVLSILFPFFFSPPITGMEYSFLEKKTEKEDFVAQNTKWIEDYFKKEK
jgi:hypothetical protein